MPYMHIKEFSYLGELLLDLKKVQRVRLPLSKLDMAELEIMRIRKNMLKVWGENKKGLKYYLDFHYYEGLRLYGSISHYDVGKCMQNLSSDLSDLQYSTIFLTLLVGLKDILVDIK